MVVRTLMNLREPGDMATAIGEGFRGPDGHVGYLLRQAHQAFRAAAQALSLIHI